MLAPYGGRAPLLEHLRSGPINLLQKGGPVIFTLTVWNWKKLKYEVFFSKIYHFQNDITKDQAHKVIYEEYSRMARLTGISKKQMLESKSGSTISRGTWKFLSKVISLYVLCSDRVHKKKKN